MSNPLFALDPEIPYLGILAGAAALVFLSFVMLLVNRYKRCPSNKVLVIYGKVGAGNTARCIHGGAARQSSSRLPT